MDVKCGRGAFMKTRADARRLAESLVATGAANGVQTAALVTAMDVPLGRAVGNSLEVIECLETLKGRGPADLEALSVALAARMLLLGGAAADLPQAEAKVRQALASGRGLEKFREVIARQGGDVRVVEDYARLPAAPNRVLVRARRPGYVTQLDAELIGRATMLLGAGRDRVEDRIDPGVGAVVLAPLGQKVREEEPVVEVHYRDSGRLQNAVALIEEAYVVGDAPPPEQPQILEAIG
jgi:thymidine phosphorylase